MCDGGPLFGQIVDSGKFDEEEARFFFKQIVNGVKYAHEQGVAHGKLRVENILLGTNYNVKISDFGSKTKGGLDGYTAPE